MEFLSTIRANHFVAPHDKAARPTCAGLGVAERRAARQTRPLAYRVCHTAVIARQAGKAFRELV